MEDFLDMGRLIAEEVNVHNIIIDGFRIEYGPTLAKQKAKVYYKNKLVYEEKN